MWAWGYPDSEMIRILFSLQSLIYVEELVFYYIARPLHFINQNQTYYEQHRNCCIGDYWVSWTYVHRLHIWVHCNLFIQGISDEPEEMGKVKTFFIFFVLSNSYIWQCNILFDIGAREYLGRYLWHHFYLSLYLFVPYIIIKKIFHEELPFKLTL